MSIPAGRSTAAGKSAPAQQSVVVKNKQGIAYKSPPKKLWLGIQIWDDEWKPVLIPAKATKSLMNGMGIVVTAEATVCIGPDATPTKQFILFNNEGFEDTIIPTDDWRRETHLSLAKKVLHSKENYTPYRIALRH
jgi:hypothetical protein